MSKNTEAAEKLLKALEEILGNAADQAIAEALGNPKTREEAQAFMDKLEEGCEDVTIGDQAADVVILITNMVHSDAMVKLPVEVALPLLEIMSSIGAIASMCNSLYKRTDATLALIELMAEANKAMSDQIVDQSERIKVLENVT